MDDLAFTASMDMGMGFDDNTFTWEMIGLGLEEPLPPQETIDELYVFIPTRITEFGAHMNVQPSNILRQNTPVPSNGT